MQIVEEQALRQDNPSDPATRPTPAARRSPRAPSSRRAPTRSPLCPSTSTSTRTSPEASGYYVDQHLALSVLDPNVPIRPTSIPTTASASGSRPGKWDERAGLRDVGSDDPLQRRLGTAGGGGYGARKRAPDPRQADPPRSTTARPCSRCSATCRRHARDSSSSRTSRLRGQAAPSAAPRRSRHLRGAPFKIPAGKKRTVRAALNGAGRRLLAHRGEAKGR